MSASRKVVPRHASSSSTSPAWSPGSSTGEGLGNRFLAGIREADALCLVLRAFEDDNVSGDSDPLSDLGVLELELVLADAATVESQIDKRRKAARADKSLAGEVAALERAQAELEAGSPIYRSALTPDDRTLLEPFFLLTNKPVLAVVNLGRTRCTDAEAIVKPVADELGGHGDVLGVSVELEAEAAQLDPRRSGPSCSRGSASARAPCPGWPGPPITCSAGARSSPPATRRAGPGPSGPAPRRRSAPA